MLTIAVVLMSRTTMAWTLELTGTTTPTILSAAGSGSKIEDFNY